MEFNGCGFIGSDSQLVTALSKRKIGTKLVKWDIATKKQLKSVKVFSGFHHTAFATRYLFKLDSNYYEHMYISTAILYSYFLRVQ